MRADASGPRLGRSRATGRGQDRPGAETVRRGVVSALRGCFNFLALNLVLVVACLPVVTVPVAVGAAVTALDRWRTGGEDRVVREFIGALRRGRPGHACLALGAPFVAIAVALEEVHFFAHGGSPVSWVCLGSGFAALVIVLTSCGYVIVLGARQPELPVTDLWAVCARVALRNVVPAGALIMAEFALAVLLGLLDPALCLIGLPLAFLVAVRWTAGPGLRGAGLGPVAKLL
jgi:hypothetical protein